MKSTSGFTSADLYRTASELPEVDRKGRVELPSGFGVSPSSGSRRSIASPRRLVCIDGRCDRHSRLRIRWTGSDRCASDSVLGSVVTFNNRIHDIDWQVPRKPPHPAKQIWVRSREEIDG